MAVGLPIGNTCCPKDREQMPIRIKAKMNRKSLLKKRIVVGVY
jgi:hypothetical protein